MDGVQGRVERDGAEAGEGAERGDESQRQEGFYHCFSFAFACQAFCDCQASLPAEQDTDVAGGPEEPADDGELLQFDTRQTVK